ncbi:uncharacterized protein LOC143335009 [Chaetodon auriga]|uniref:uncharacterized protein LOC143335009 n=1 Tax=Chaetodon auriga TaxID=39042 RepID=UPI0040329ECA
MSKVQTLRAFVEQRLTAAAEEIMELFERTIAEYEEELCRQRKLLDAVFQPEVRLHRADVQQLLVSQEEDPPEQQDCLDSLDQEEPPELPHIKEEQEELWTNQEADISKFTLSVPVKSEEEVDEEEPQSSQLHQRQTEQMKTGSDGEDCGGPGPDRNLNPDHLQAATHDTTSDSSEPETDDSCDWEERKKPFNCSECGKRFAQISKLTAHFRVHTGEKPFKCSVCEANFSCRSSLSKHMRIHTGEKRFSCSHCGKRFTQHVTLRQHLTVHTGEKPFSCTVCGKRFTQHGTWKRHSTVHTGEKPFNCTVCGKGFARKTHLKRHSAVHTGEKPFSCSMCGKSFCDLVSVKKHKCAGESRGRKGNWRFSRDRQRQIPPSGSVRTQSVETEGGSGF